MQYLGRASRRVDAVVEDLIGASPSGVESEDIGFFRGGRIVGDEFEQETVKLGFGKVVGPFRLDRVLGRHHEEGRFEDVPGAVDRDPGLLHDFEQRGVGLRGRPVDLVSQEQLGEDGAGSEAELSGVLLVDRCPGNVRGHQVGSELDPVEIAAKDPAKHPDEERLAQSWNTFNQNVPLGKQGNEDPSDQLLLADVDLVDLLLDPRGPLGDGGRGRGDR